MPQSTLYRLRDLRCINNTGCDVADKFNNFQSCHRSQFYFKFFSPAFFSRLHYALLNAFCHVVENGAGRILDRPIMLQTSSNDENDKLSQNELQDFSLLEFLSDCQNVLITNQSEPEERRAVSVNGKTCCNLKQT